MRYNYFYIILIFRHLSVNSKRSIFVRRIYFIFGWTKILTVFKLARCRISSKTRHWETNPTLEKVLIPLVFPKALLCFTNFVNISIVGCQQRTLRQSMIFQTTFEPALLVILKLIWLNGIIRLLIAESHDSDVNLMAYYGNSTHRGIPPFNFKFITHIHNSSNASYIKQILEEWIELLPGNTSTNWVVKSFKRYNRV